MGQDRAKIGPRCAKMKQHRPKMSTCKKRQKPRCFWGRRLGWSSLSASQKEKPGQGRGAPSGRVPHGVPFSFCEAEKVGEPVVPRNAWVLAVFCISEFCDILALCWPILDLSWPYLGPSWPILAPSWPHLDPILAHLGLSLAHLGPFWRDFDPTWRFLAGS